MLDYQSGAQWCKLENIVDWQINFKNLSNILKCM